MRFLTAGAVLGIAVASGCASRAGSVSDSAPAEDLDWAEQAAVGREIARSVEETHGRYDDQDLDSYLQRLGQRVVEVSGMGGRSFRFAVLDSPSVNALSVPGGFVWVTRGLLAYINNEAALVGVLSHLVGHAELAASAPVEGQQNEEDVARTGEDFTDPIRVAPELARHEWKAVSQPQENEVTRLGARYTSLLGYDPRELLPVLNLLELDDDAELGVASLPSPLPEWRSVHGASSLARDVIRSFLEQPFSSSSQGIVAAEAYLREIDGLIFGTNPCDGNREQNRFVQPCLAIEIAFPDGFEISRTHGVVYASAPGMNVFLRMSASRTEGVVDPESYARDFLREHRLETATGERFRLGPFYGYRAPFRAYTGKTPLIGHAGFFVDGKTVHEVLAMADETNFPRFDSAFVRAIRSVRRVRERDLLHPMTVGIGLRAATTGMRLSEVLSEAEVEPDRFELHAGLNGRELESRYEEGALVKILQVRAR